MEDQTGIIYLLISFKIMSKMFTKIVQNYIIQSTNHTTPNQVQIYTATHKILKKKFTLKKVTINQPFCQSVKQKRTALTRPEWAYQNLMKEVGVLKRHSGQTMPKCHKIIKTTHSIYLVYDQFPGTPLLEGLLQHKYSISEKLQLLLLIAKQVQCYHNQGIVLLNLSARGIRLTQQKTFFIWDWSLARQMQDGYLIGHQHIVKDREFFAQEILEKGCYSFASDVYSLGRVIEKVINGESLLPLQADGDLKELIRLMTNENHKERASLPQAVKRLQKCRDSPKERSSPSKCTLVKLKTLKQIDENDSSKWHEQQNNIIAIKDIPILYKNYSLRDQIIEDSARTSRQKSQLTINHPYQIISSSRRTRIASLSKKLIESTVKSICKKRNFSFFILTLAEFIVTPDLSIDLIYILTKYARLNHKKIYEELTSKQYGEDQQRINHFMAIIKQQYNGITNSEQLIKYSIATLGLQGDIRHQFMDQNCINDRFMKNRIIEFSKQMIVLCEQQSSSILHQEVLHQNLFSTFLILKAVQVGSYDRFWQKTSEKDQMYLSNPVLMKAKAAFSIRFLKSKVAEILNQKLNAI